LIVTCRLHGIEAQHQERRAIESSAGAIRPAAAVSYLSQDGGEPSVESVRQTASEER
jgi:hypothetical protein